MLLMPNLHPTSGHKILILAADLSEDCSCYLIPAIGVIHGRIKVRKYA